MVVSHLHLLGAKRARLADGGGVLVFVLCAGREGVDVFKEGWLEKKVRGAGRQREVAPLYG